MQVHQLAAVQARHNSTTREQACMVAHLNQDCCCELCTATHLVATERWCLHGREGCGEVQV